MNYRTILVNLDTDRPIKPITNAAVDLASQVGARLIGLCAAQAFLSPFSMQATSYAATSAMQQMYKDLEDRMEQVYQEFRAVVAGRVELEWRAEMIAPTEAIVEAARAADLIIMAAAEGAHSGDSYRTADPATVMLRAGRPVLIAGSGKNAIPVEKIVVCWKDTREARRAVVDAVPLISFAKDVIVVSVSSKPDASLRRSNADVVSYLTRHNVKARSHISKSADETIGLLQSVDQSGADLIVSGAYGHSRLRELVFGGVTRFLLDEGGRNRFMSS
ncbi:nucleotide-binding universal stress UspA family protein [Shinella sp. BE166]|uniref:universal stress protein n=1 Tax=unclassified Shinella TaxID=2643062 RepID=UPI003EBCFFBD